MKKQPADARLLEAFVVDDFDAMMNLVEMGIDPDTRDPRDDGTMLHRAVVLNRLDFARFLIKKGANVNLQEKKKGLTALHVAALYKLSEFVSLLLGAGADANIRCKFGATPLAYAITGTESNRLELAKLLVAGGADKSIVVNSMSPLALELNGEILNQI
jgi:ankyrin repeat protein